MNKNAEALKRNYLELSELREVLRKTQTFFQAVSLLCGKPGSDTGWFVN